MSAVWTTLSSSLLVLIIFFAEYVCGDDIFTGAALRIGDSIANRSHPRQGVTLNNQDWPSLGEKSSRSSTNFRVQSQVGAWPESGDRSRTNQNNYNNNRNWQPSPNNSYVASQVDKWNARLNSNTSYADSLHNAGQRYNVGAQQIHFGTTRRPFTGIKFDEPNGSIHPLEDSADKKSNSVQVTDNELREFAETLLLKDENNAARYVTANFQGRTTSRSRNDEAPLPLLSIDKAAYNIPTIAKLQPLYDNYIVRSNINEDYTNQEKQEENIFLKAILETDVMKATRNFLIEKGAISRSERDFEHLLHNMWFNLYSRGKGKVGSSGFEHVFLAEIKNGDVSGLHNWLYFAREEAENRSNYLGYLKKIDLGNKGAILKFNFDFHGINKPVGSMFIGTSPELEMALYSTCFIFRADRVCPLKLNGHRFVIRTYTYKYNGENLIGSAFAEI